MTRRSRSVGAFASALFGLAWLASGAPARAQSTDARAIRPDVMLLVDTSGSMEWRTGVLNNTCTGADGGPCNRCSNGATICSPSCPVSENQNRWTTALEVLTGTILNYSCTEIARTDPTQFDYLYPVPYHRPLSGGVPLWTSSSTQSGDGILDSYRDSVRFGLMTFDNDYRVGVHANDGMFSYGPDTIYLANGCVGASTPINVGSRRASTDPVADPVPGGLVSVGPPSADSATLNGINAQIQSAIIGSTTTEIRPYGGTPIAGMLSDAYYYWTTNPDVAPGATGDPYFNCRGRYNILITDGQPNMDFRPACVGGTGVCPYDTPDTTALRLSATGGSAPGVKTYVIAFNATDPGAVASLTPIAFNGGTMNVLYASDRATLQTTLSNVLNGISARTTTRTSPTFSSVTSSTGAQSAVYQFQSSFAVASGYPWEGILERQRTTCQGSPTPTPTPQTIDATCGAYCDDYGYALRESVRAGRGLGTRALWTWVPTSVHSTAAARATFRATPGSGTPIALTTAIDPQIWGFPAGDTTDEQTMIYWLLGHAGTVRETRPLGDIYHSNPVVVDPPNTPLPDQTYSSFRSRLLAAGHDRPAGLTVGTRESVLYVGTNDGILHAFRSSGNGTPPDRHDGEEMWGFVPPFLTGTIPGMIPANHQYGVDGTPVVRDIVLARSAADFGDQSRWMTLLVVGLRGGGGAYEALDVTDPYNPQFLWQFTDSHMQSAYGTPAIGTAFVNWSPAISGAITTSPGERAVVVLPGGSAAPATGCTGALTAAPWIDSRLPNSGWGPRGQAGHRCWNSTDGQYLYVVDVQSGQTIASFGPTGSPMVGAVSLYLGTPGTVATRGYVGDADGRVWRLDLSNPNPAQWKLGVVFDLFPTGGATSGEPVVSMPVVSIDRDGSTLIAAGSGDPDTLDGTDSNAIASYRETVVTDTTGAATAINVARIWQLAVGANPDTSLFAGERLTGPMSLFNGTLYFGSFVPRSGADACQMGSSRLWGLSMTDVVGTAPAGKLNLTGDPTNTVLYRSTFDITGNTELLVPPTNPPLVNSVLFGVGIVRSPQCTTSTSATDAFFPGGTYSQPSSMTGGTFSLVIQSGNGGTASNGARTNVVSRPLATPVVDARLNAWAVVFE